MKKHVKMHEANPTIFSCPQSNYKFKCIRNGDLARHNLTARKDPAM